MRATFGGKTIFYGLLPAVTAVYTFCCGLAATVNHSAARVYPLTAAVGQDGLPNQQVGKCLWNFAKQNKVLLQSRIQQKVIVTSFYKASCSINVTRKVPI